MLAPVSSVKAELHITHDGDVVYNSLWFNCPGCEEFGGSGLHMLPVNSTRTSPAWEWDGNIEAPTLSPSILTRTYRCEGEARVDLVCHSYLKAGVIEFLGDCTHSLAGQHVPLPDLPDWFRREVREALPVGA